MDAETTRPKLIAELQATGNYLKGLSAVIRERESALSEQGAALSELQRKSDELLEELDRLNNTFTIRLRNRILGAPLLGRLIERLIARGRPAGSPDA